MLDLLDDLMEIAYAVDVSTYELFYLNCAAQRAFQMQDYHGKPCYQTLFGFDFPCPFCKIAFLSNGTTLSDELMVPSIHGLCLRKSHLLQQQGRSLQITLLSNLTSPSSELVTSSTAFDSEQMILGCIHELYQEQNLDQGIHRMLRRLGQDLSAERAYIFDVQHGRMSNTYEWCATGIEPQQESLQELDLSLLNRWQLWFHRSECVLISDLEEIRESDPLEYENLSRQSIHSLVAAPLERDGKLCGFLGVDNPTVEKMVTIGPLLNTLCYFLISTMRRLEGEEQLKRMSYFDPLTGLFNRNRYMRDLERLEQWTGPVGVVYADLNGLKEINDHHGHSQGDAALIQCARHLQSAFPSGRHYRIGGDEYVVLQKDMPPELFDKHVNNLRQQFAEDGLAVAIGAQWEDTGMDVEQMVQEADTKMYADKRQFYRSHTNSSRYRNFGERSLSKGSLMLKEYNMLIHSLHVGVSKHLLRENFEVLWANRFFYEMTGYTEAEHNARFHNRCNEYFANDLPEYERARDLIWDAFHRGKASFELLLHMPHKDGHRRWVQVVGTFTDEQIGGVPVIYAVLTDVSEMVRIQREQAVTYDSLPGFVTIERIAPEEPQWLYGNERFHKFFGNVNETPSQLMLDYHQANKEVLQEQYPLLRQGKSTTFPICAKSVSGNTHYFQVYAGCVDWYQADPIMLFLYFDNTAATQQREQLRRLAYVDPVTGGRNRASFEMDAGAAVASAYPNTYALISMDVQKFKVINDLFGTDCGDRTLRHIYRKIEARLHPGEFVARLSSDTFSILLKAEARSIVEHRIQEIVEEVNQFNQHLDHKYLLMMTVGVYYITEPTLPMTQIQDRANVARKNLKRKAGIHLFDIQYYSHKERLLLTREKEIENQMQDALESGQFVIYLQAKQSLMTGRVAGAEALVRWMNPERGLIPPDEFVPLFEKNGFISELDLHVFEQVCGWLRTWIDQGRNPVPISVNMSKAHLSDGNFLDHYEEIRQRYGVPPALLEIEITETLVFENPYLLSQVIDEIHEKGYHCSMDDFGSGYSSLNVLKDIRVDVLKLDKAFFVSEEVNKPWEAAIISGVVELARKLQMRTVAEGVETIQQAEFLRKAGCDMIQGYLFARPVPPKQFEAFAFGEDPPQP